MFWLMVALVGVIVFVVAALAAGQGGQLAPAEPDRPELDLPSTGPLRAEHLERLRFPVVLRGYRMDEVDGVLDRLGAELRARDTRISDLEGRLGSAHARLRSLGEPGAVPGAHPEGE